jgi:hypothetical protein
MEQWHRYLLFDATTSLGWDTGRAVTNVLAIVIAGPAALAAFRRAARRANFQPEVTFGPPRSGPHALDVEDDGQIAPGQAALGGHAELGAVDPGGGPRGERAR